MFSLKAFFVPKVIRFVLITIIRIVGIVAMLLVISAEVWEMVRNIQGYAADVKLRHDEEASAVLTNSTILRPDLCGYVMSTTVPDHAGGIFFSTFFRFLNVIVLFFLLVSEISLPIPAIYNFYLRNFPPLSEDASLGFLGAAMMWIATSVLSADVANFAMTSAWILFIMGFLNVLLGVIAGSSARETRSVFVTDKSKRDILPTNSSSKQKKGKGVDPHISYPAPMNIGFPAPAAMSKSSLGLGNYNTAGGAADLGFYMSPHAAVSRPSLSETVERRAASPLPASNIHRSRSGKGVVTIKTDVEEIDDLPHKPPSYAHGTVV